VDYDISPEPEEAERAAILAALGADENEGPPRSSWAESLLPGRLPEEGEP
jgi:hypothetical protein